jgi:hypothetical protein
VNNHLVSFKHILVIVGYLMKALLLKVSIGILVGGSLANAKVNDTLPNQPRTQDSRPMIQRLEVAPGMIALDTTAEAEVNEALAILAEKGIMFVNPRTKEIFFLKDAGFANERNIGARIQTADEGGGGHTGNEGKGHGGTCKSCQ